MLKLYIFSLLAIILALLVSIYVGFPADPGYLLIAFGNYTFETSLFALLVAFGIVFLLLRILQLVFHWLNPWQLVRFGRAYSNQRRSRKRSRTVEGLLCFARGNWASAQTLLIRSAKDSDASVINYLAAACAAQSMGDRAEAMRCLDLAEKEFPFAHSTIHQLKATLLFRADQLEQSVAILEQLKRTTVNDPPLLNLLKEVYIKLEDWLKLEQLLPALEKNNVIDNTELERIRTRIFVESLYATGGKATIKAERETQIADLMKLWKKAPGKYREDSKVVRHFADLLLGLDAKTEAAKVYETALAKRWNDELVVRYGEESFGLDQQQLIEAEGWLQNRPGNASLLLSLGRICRRNELWGKSREYYEASIRIGVSIEAYGELAELLRALGESAAAEQALQKYKKLAGGALSELPLPQPKQVNEEPT